MNGVGGKVKDDVYANLNEKLPFRSGSIDGIAILGSGLLIVLVLPPDSMGKDILKQDSK